VHINHRQYGNYINKMEKSKKLSNLLTNYKKTKELNKYFMCQICGPNCKSFNLDMTEILTPVKCAIKDDTDRM
jgi:hypothetical protein